MTTAKKVYWSLLQANAGKYVYYVILSIISAAGNMGIIYIINTVLRELISGKFIPTQRYILLFAAAMIVFFVIRWLVAKNIIGFTQEVLARMRLEILQMTLRSAWYPLVRNKERIYSAMTRDVGNIVGASISLVDIMTNLLIAIICFVYMGILSWKLLLCMMGLIVFTVFIYMRSEKKGHALFMKAMKHDDRFTKYLNEILDGFKEIVIDRRKGFRIEQKHMVDAVDASSTLNKKALVTFLNNRVIGQMAFYAFIGALMLSLGKAMHIDSDTLISFIFLVLYAFGPIETVVISIPGFSQAKSSLERLSTLREDLQETEGSELRKTDPPVFRKLEMKSIYYEYENEHDSEKPFSVGPLDFHLEAGEIVFLSGGNGSGKTTFINLLIGLFSFDSGEVFLNGPKVEDVRSYEYRSLFAPVFSDFHLFDECYSIDHPDPATISRYIRLFELEDKVAFEGTRFTTLDLSTGQRKRLALICAMLEKKPVLVLDEFGADQDPHFRKKFYTVILEMLRQEGFTILAITHDDNYYNYCDHLYKMNYGSLERIQVMAPARTIV